MGTRSVHLRGPDDGATFPPLDAAHSRMLGDTRTVGERVHKGHAGMTLLGATCRSRVRPDFWSLKQDDHLRAAA